jgi:CarboxypepD_reg-like domain
MNNARYFVVLLSQKITNSKPQTLFMRFVFLFVMLWVVGQVAQAQGYLTLSGKVIDKQTQQPVPHAYVGILSKGTGSIANDDGEFFFRFPRISADSNLVVAVLGYKMFAKKASSYTPNQKDVVIELEAARPQLMDSAFIRRFEALDLVREALAKVKKNNPQMPYMLNGFYQETLQQDSAYVEIREATLQTEKDPRPKIAIPEKVRATRGRMFESKNRSKLTENYAFPNGAAIVTRALEVGLPEYLDGSNISDYTFQIDDTISYYLDKPVYQIHFAPLRAGIKAARNGLICISSADTAIVRISYEMTPEGVKEVMKVSGTDKLFGKTKREPKRLLSQVNYKPLGGKYYLQDYQLRLETQFEQGKEKFVGTIRLHFVATDILKSNGGRIPETDILLNTDAFERQEVAKYEGILWGVNNYILPTAAMRQILETLR